MRGAAWAKTRGCPIDGNYSDLELGHSRRSAPARPLPHGSANQEKEMSHLSSSELQILYFNFIEYRDGVCNGMADMSIAKFYARYGLNRFRG